MNYHHTSDREVTEDLSYAWRTGFQPELGVLTSTEFLTQKFSSTTTHLATPSGVLLVRGMTVRFLENNDFLMRERARCAGW